MQLYDLIYAGILSDILSFILAKNNQHHAEQAAATKLACLREGHVNTRNPKGLLMDHRRPSAALQTNGISSVSPTEDILDKPEVKVFRSCFKLLHGLALKNERVK